MTSHRLSSHACLVSKMITNGVLEETDYQLPLHEAAQRLKGAQQTFSQVSHSTLGYEHAVDSDITNDREADWIPPTGRFRCLSVSTKRSSITIGEVFVRFLSRSFFYCTEVHLKLHEVGALRLS